MDPSVVIPPEPPNPYLQPASENECPRLISIGDAEQEEPTAHERFCDFLSNIHVVDMLPERSTVCTFDASLPIHEMVATILLVTHRPLEAWLSDKTPAQDEIRRRIEPVAAYLASNVLAEICEFSDEHRKERSDSKTNDNAEKVQRRSWTGPNDGWGCHPNTQVEGETMGWLQKPFTVQELAEFLVYSECEESALDWHLAAWRQLKEESSCDAQQPQAVRHGSLLTELPSPTHMSAGVGEEHNVLVQRTEGAPPRPMMRIDEQDSTFLRAVELLLHHPELNALPIVSMTQRTVLAHLTLAECLAVLVQHLRGKTKDLGEILLPDDEREFVQWKTIKDAVRAEESLEGVCVVLDAEDALYDLLEFFALTHYSAVPVVSKGNVLVGVLGRRNLLQFMDLCMESCAAQCPNDESPPETDPTPRPEKVDDKNGVAPIYFDTCLSLREVIQTLEEYSSEKKEKDEKPTGPAKFFGTGTMTAMPTLKNILCHILLSDNHKIAFIDTDRPILRRFLHVEEVIKLILYGNCEAKSQLTFSMQGI